MRLNLHELTSRSIVTYQNLSFGVGLSSAGWAADAVAKALTVGTVPDNILICGTQLRDVLASRQLA